jgi:hypothetical protein
LAADDLLAAAAGCLADCFPAAWLAAVFEAFDSADLDSPAFEAPALATRDAGFKTAGLAAAAGLGAAFAPAAAFGAVLLAVADTLPTTSLALPDWAAGRTPREAFLEDEAAFIGSNTLC